MSNNRRRRSARVIEVERDRFAAGWRLVPGGVALIEPRRPGTRRPDFTFDVFRPADLVAFTVECYGLELFGGANPLLRPKQGSSSRFVVQLSFQHLAERAIYEAPAPVPNQSSPDGPPAADIASVDGEIERPVPPIPARPARPSRLVFDVPSDTEIPFTVAGILEAMGRLPMVVHPLAKPRSGPFLIRPGGPVLHLPGGMVATLGTRGVAVTRATRGTPIPDASTAAGISALARDLRRARAILSTTTGVAVRLRDAEEDERTLAVNLGGVRHVVPSLLGRGGLVRPEIGRRVRPAKRLSRPPAALETAIESPFRLIISPSRHGGWSHSSEPVGADGAPHRIELWHTRLGVRREDGGEVAVDEKSDWQRIVRAIWARDRESMPGWETEKAPAHEDVPFRTSLDGADRHMLVRQSAETWLGKQSKPIEPRPVETDALWLSSLGAWLDLHGQWQTMPYSEVQIASILSWDHVAPMGRDQYVRVVYPGYLYPFGHRATLVKLTERKMKDASPSVAALYQRKFLVVGEPVRHYDTRSLPFISVRIAPLVTPTLNPDPGNSQNSFFFPKVDGEHFRFVLHCQDREGRPVRLLAPLLWVAEHYGDFAQVDQAYSSDPARLVAAAGQELAFTPVNRGGDSMLPTDQLQFGGAARLGSSDPHLVDATVRIPAVQQLSPVGPVTIKLAEPYLDHGFGGTQNAGEVWAELVGAPPNLSFGGSTAAGSDRAGGFLQPDLPIRALSRIKGTVGDVTATATSGFNPAAFLAGALPKLFGIVPLVDLLEAAGVDLDDAPDVVSEALDRIEGFLSDLERAKRAAQDSVANANLMVDRANGKAAELQQQAAQALNQAQQLEATVTAAVDQIIAKFATLANASQLDITNALTSPLQALRDAAEAMDQAAPLLPPLIRQQLRKLAAVLRSSADAADIVEDIYRFLNGLGTSAVQSVFRFEWRPKLKSWPAGSPILAVQPHSLVLAVDGRASGKGEMGVDVLAELRDFTLNLLPGEPLVRFKFDHLSFRAGSSSKAEVDVVLQEIEFLGLLGFVETLKQLIPFDGFSDPPYVDVTPEGLTAGFSLGLPNVSVGVFNLSNMSLGADVQVPFLGSAVTVGFNFCTRERPFALAVTFIGGGGWFLMRLSPDGLDVLELGLEAGAMLAVDFGVASGSISAMLGIYMRLEGDAGSLTGYFRLRGEVDVLGLISASIELYLALLYQFATGKMVGTAKLTIKIEVFVFSGSVTITAERRFAGSAGDPSFADLMVLPDGTSPAWTEYCTAFSGE